MALGPEFIIVHIEKVILSLVLYQGNSQYGALAGKLTRLGNIKHMLEMTIYSTQTTVSESCKLAGPTNLLSQIKAFVVKY